MYQKGLINAFLSDSLIVSGDYSVFATRNAQNEVGFLFPGSCVKCSFFMIIHGIFSDCKYCGSHYLHLDLYTIA